MTEDDTFRKLRQMPLLDLVRVWSMSPIRSSDPERDDFFKVRGWTWEEYTVKYDDADAAGMLTNLYD
jgi:hypothetical protein